MLGVLSLFLFIGVGRVAARLLGGLSADVVVVLLAAGASLLLLRATLLRWPDALWPGLLLVVFGGQLLLGSGAVLLLRPPTRALGTFGLILAVAGLGLDGWGVFWVLSAGADPHVRAPIGQPEAPAVVLDEDPASPGPYSVVALTYGSGGDERRPEYGAEVDIETTPVDLRAVLPEWRGFRASHREWWWGFGLAEAPRNGRLQMPEVEEGDRRPLALIVHGNHRMDDFSDGGYEYLTELLASHGIAAASVDANFLNGAWSGDFGGREMPARAILLLEHLRLFRSWNRDPRSRFHDRLDLSRVALIGHSRGGEAAAIAAAFNDLDRFPDNADFAFDYRFGIESVVAIAQIDRRYSRRIVLDDINFLALQGSYDTDEPSFHGLRQYHRTRFGNREAEDAPAGPAPQLGFRLKAGVLLHRGNHGQFNSTWGMDSGLFGVWWLNRAPLVPAADQQRVAAVYISAFLRATLLGERRFVPLLRDYRAGSALLPETLYQSQYQDSLTEILAGFEEDLDLGTAGAPGSTVGARGFSGWSEEEVIFRDGSKTAASAVRLAFPEDGRSPPEPTYEIGLDQPVAFGASDDLVFSVVWNPETPDAAGDTPYPRPLLAMTAQLLFGEREGPPFEVANALSPEPPFEVRFLKSERMNRERYRRTIEEIPQTITIPGARLLPPARGIPAPQPEGASESPEALTGVRFRMDAAVPGEVLLDDIGIRRALPASGAPQ